ncbi:MAG TPA: OsmC family protein, partial [Cryomorphaceae bacterium]|nr:OsmC family protein [Cryomorphaceae bacterium]
LNFKASNYGSGYAIVDGETESDGMRPMELLLSALGTCAAFDIVKILEKQRQEVRDVQIDITGDRSEDGYPNPFTKILLDFRIYGFVDEAKANRAVTLAVDKYCSVRDSLSPDIVIEHRLEIIEQ